MIYPNQVHVTKTEAKELMEEQLRLGRKIGVEYKVLESKLRTKRFIQRRDLLELARVKDATEFVIKELSPVRITDKGRYYLNRKNLELVSYLVEKENPLKYLLDLDTTAWAELSQVPGLFPCREIKKKLEKDNKENK